MHIQTSVYGLSAALATRGAMTGDSEAQGAGFASLLRQSQNAPAPQAPAAPPTTMPMPAQAAPAPASSAQAGAPKPAPQSADPAPADHDAEDRGAKDATATATANADPQAANSSDAQVAQQAISGDTHTFLRAKLRAADSSATAKSGKGGKTDSAEGDKSAALDKQQETAPHATNGNAADPALNPLAAALPLPGQTPPVRADVGTGKTDSGNDDPAANLAAPSASDVSAASRDASAPAASAAADAAASARADQGVPAPDAGFAALLAEHRTNESNGATRSSLSTAAIDGTASAAASAAAFGAAPAAGTAAAQPVDVPTPVNSPDFAQHLGVQLSLLAKDGVQQAELHLNPADMGPVSVQITMDGTQARIDFGADVAATRHAIEAGLPALASALADAGFTLAGGGVSQHSGGQRDGGKGSGNGGQAGFAGHSKQVGSVDATSAASQAVRRNVSIGGLDIYA